MPNAKSVLDPEADAPWVECAIEDSSDWDRCSDWSSEDEIDSQPATKSSVIAMLLACDNRQKGSRNQATDSASAVTRSLARPSADSVTDASASCSEDGQLIEIGHSNLECSKQCLEKAEEANKRYLFGVFCFVC